MDSTRAIATDHSPTSAAGWRAALPGLTLLALRVICALILFERATARWFGFPINPGRPFTGAPEMFSRPWFATVLELVGGFLIMVGLFTRPAAFVLSGLMAFAYFIAHAPESFFPVVNRGEPAVLLCFIFLYMSAYGAGPYSADAAIGRRRAIRLAQGWTTDAERVSRAGQVGQ